MARFLNSYEVGEKLLGPILIEYLEKLYKFLSTYDTEDTVIFFMARGGLGIRLLFEEYLEKTHKELKVEFKNFYASRLSVAKGCFNNDTDHIINYLSENFKGFTYKEMIYTIYKEFKTEYEWPLEDKKVTAAGLKDILNNTDIGNKLKAYLIYQSSYFARYIEELSKNKRNIILIDTGWLATSQENLMRAYPNKNWIGCYFGKWDYYGKTPWYFNQVYGLGIDTNVFNREYVRAAVLFYHHIIEGPLEAEILSTEEYKDIKANIIPNIETTTDLFMYFNNDFIKGIQYYIDHMTGEENVSHKARQAYRQLARMIIFPNKKEVEILKVGSRGADFGKNIEVPVVQEYKEYNKCYFYKLKKKIYNVRHAIWKQGQMVYEFPYVYRLMQGIYFLMRYNRPIKP